MHQGLRSFGIYLCSNNLVTISATFKYFKLLWKLTNRGIKSFQRIELIKQLVEVWGVGIFKFLNTIKDNVLIIKLTALERNIKDLFICFLFQVSRSPSLWVPSDQSVVYSLSQPYWCLEITFLFVTLRPPNLNKNKSSEITCWNFMATPWVFKNSIKMLKKRWNVWIANLY